MPVHRRALALLPLALLCATAPARAATIATAKCVPFIDGVRTMPVVGTGFTPGTTATLHTTTATRRKRKRLVSVKVSSKGTFRVVVHPPGLRSRRATVQGFALTATDDARPTARIVVPKRLRVIRFGLSRTPSPRRPGQRVKFVARGFVPNKMVYAHFRYGDRTRRTVQIGLARSACGIATRRMRALPTKVRYGVWTVFVDQSKRYSKNTRPQWIDPFNINRIKRKPKPTTP